MGSFLIALGHHEPLATAQDHLARRCASELERRGLRWRQLAHEHGLDLGRPHREGARVLARCQHAFVRDAERLADDPFLGWSLGAWDLRDLGLFGYSLLSAPDVGTALEMMIERSAILSEAANLTLRLDGDKAVLGQSFAANGAMSAAWLHFFLCSLWQLAGPDIELLHLGVHLLDQDRLDGLAERVGQPVEGFEAPVTFVTFKAEVLDRPVGSADAALSRTLDWGWHQERRILGARRSELAALETVITRLLATEEPTVASCAAALGVSALDLKEKLDRLGLALHEIVDAIRAGLAVRLLARPNMTLTRAANALGLSEPAALAHAHRRWWGIPPVDGRGRPLHVHAGVASRVQLMAGEFIL